MSSHALASTKSSADMKFRTTKISSEGLDGKSAKFCTSKYFLLYGIKVSVILMVHCSVMVRPSLLA